MMIHTKYIKGSRFVVSDKKIFLRLPYKNLCKIFDFRGGAIFSPRGIILTNLVEVYY